jgi:hypothetical protein
VRFRKYLDLNISLFWGKCNNLFQAVLSAPTLCLGFQTKNAYSAAVALLEFWNSVIAQICEVRRMAAMTGSDARWALVPVAMALGLESACQFHKQPLQSLRSSLLEQMRDYAREGTIEALKLFWEWPDNADRLRGVWYRYFKEVQTRNMIAWDLACTRRRVV